LHPAAAPAWVEVSATAPPASSSDAAPAAAARSHDLRRLFGGELFGTCVMRFGNLSGVVGRLKSRAGHRGRP
jgi:hypothetical protein